LNTKEDIMKNFGNYTVDGIHRFSYYFSSLYWSQWLRQTVWLPTYLLLCSTQ